jgi:nucleotidyltransferase/DNA polymerase involved in DNA repair
MDNLEAIQGVGAATANKLQQAGYESCAQVASATATDLKEKIGLPLTVAERIIASAKTLVEPEQAQAALLASREENSGVTVIEIDEVIKGPGDSLEAIDKRQLANQLVNTILQNPEAVQRIAQEVSAELAEILGRKLRKKLAKAALSKKKFRKSLISGLIKELKKM